MKLTVLMTLAMLAASTTTTTAAQQHARTVHVRSTTDSSRLERQKNCESQGVPGHRGETEHDAGRAPECV